MKLFTGGCVGSDHAYRKAVSGVGHDTAIIMRNCLTANR
jgi:hypothetical protein